MRIIKPIEMADAVLSASDVPENDHPVYSVLSDYAVGDYVISTATHTIYRALVANGPGNGGVEDPDDEQAALADPLIADPNPIHWQVISATNRWKMFSKKPSQQTTQASQVDVDLLPGEIAGGLAVFNTVADTLQVVVNDPIEGVVYDQTFELVDNTAVVDWYSYFFEPIAQLTEMVVTDLPPYQSATITATFLSTGTVSVGELIIGPVWTLGITEVSSRIGVLDFSYVQNDEFGNLETVRRESVRTAEFVFWTSTLTLLSLDSRLRELRGGSPAVWIGDEDSRKASLNFGFYSDYDVVYEEGDLSLINARVQGI